MNFHDRQYTTMLAQAWMQVHLSSKKLTSLSGLWPLEEGLGELESEIVQGSIDTLGIRNLWFVNDPPELRILGFETHNFCPTQTAAKE